MNTTQHRTSRTPLNYAALLYGAVFLLVGVAGFIPGLTQDVGSMSVVGHHSEAMLLGLFQVSVLHNVVHLLYGVVGILVWRLLRGARSFLLWGGLIYAVLWAYGLFVNADSAANFVPLNTADNWLHLVLAGTMIGLSFLPGRGAGPLNSYPDRTIAHTKPQTRASQAPNARVHPERTTKKGDSPAPGAATSPSAGAAGPVPEATTDAARPAPDEDLTIDQEPDHKQ